MARRLALRLRLRPARPPRSTKSEQTRCSPLRALCGHCANSLAAYYRSALAEELKQRGFAIEGGTGKDGRYFEIAGVPHGLVEAFSARSREVAGAVERFRARWGRAPERGELRRLKLENRKAKVPVTKADLQRAWSETAARFESRADGQGRLFGSAGEREPDRLLGAGGQGERDRPLGDRVEERLTERAATFTPGELRAVVLEQSVGELSPAEALAFCGEMVGERRVLPLEGGLMTTLAVRAREQAVERRFTVLAQPVGREVGERARQAAGDEVAKRIGARLSGEQERALEVMTGPERGAVLVGPAGTGKGVVIDAAARAENYAGRETVGVAVSGSTAQRLGRDSPALERAGLPRVHFHDLRHCFATLAVQKLPLPSVQGYMGHAHISTTMRYVHHSPATEDAAKLAEALSGDRPPAPEPIPVG